MADASGHPALEARESALRRGPVDRHGVQGEFPSRAIDVPRTPAGFSAVLHHPDALVCDALAAVLTNAGLKVEIAATWLEVLALATTAPDVIVVGVVERYDECQEMRSLSLSAPEIPILVIADDSTAVPACEQCRWDAVCYPSDGVDCLTDSIARILAGGRARSTVGSRRARTSTHSTPVTGGLASLTRREREVLQLVMQGRGTVDIAEAIGVSVSTARTHVKSVLSKLGAHTRLQLFAKVRDLESWDSVG